MRKRIFIPLILLLTLAGCVAPTKANLASDEECIEEAKKDCPTEPFSYVSKKRVEVNPPKYEYYFKSDVRDLEFTVSSGFSHSTFLGQATAFGYEQSVHSDYVKAVHALYEEELEKILNSGSIAVHSEADICAAAKAIGDANELYAQELAYNSPTWLSENPLKVVYVDVYCNPYEPEKDFFKSSETDYDTTVHFMVKGQDTTEGAEGKIRLAIDDFYTMKDYYVTVGRAAITKTFPSCFDINSYDGIIEGRTVTKDSFVCKESEIPVRTTEEFKNSINQFIEEYNKENSGDKYYSDHIGDLNIEEYEEKGHKCYCVTYNIYHESHVSGETKSFVVELYQDIGESNYYFAQVDKYMEEINADDVKKYFSALE